MIVDDKITLEDIEFTIWRDFDGLHLVSPVMLINELHDLANRVRAKEDTMTASDSEAG
jgi:hypothetical protein